MTDGAPINYLFAISSILFFFSVIPSLLALWKNRNALKGFSLTGAIITLVGLLFMYAGYLSYNLYLNVLFALPLFLFWSAVTYYCAKMRINNTE